MIKIYELYPTFHGYSNKTVEYRHEQGLMHIAASSIRQAYYFAHNDVWASEDACGIVEKGRHNQRMPWKTCFGTRSCTALTKHGASTNNWQKWFAKIEKIDMENRKDENDTSKMYHD